MKQTPNCRQEITNTYSIASVNSQELAEAFKFDVEIGVITIDTSNYAFTN